MYGLAQDEDVVIRTVVPPMLSVTAAYVEIRVGVQCLACTAAAAVVILQKLLEVEDFILAHSSDLLEPDTFYRPPVVEVQLTA